MRELCVRSPKLPSQLSPHPGNTLIPLPQPGASAALAWLLSSLLLSCFLILLPNQLP